MEKQLGVRKHLRIVEKHKGSWSGPITVVYALREHIPRVNIYSALSQWLSLYLGPEVNVMGSRDDSTSYYHPDQAIRCFSVPPNPSAAFYRSCLQF